ncbi:MAG: hypothetical protein JO171_09125 [Paludibacterium sp.]|uniref:hypothetical protein n=1 Tax=Paludibacterium sp. TaxID=1917523 RepID=UPI0025D7C3D9|nr:hypothetical protein [Paludibacterium sp.]MBV8047302.1 hypothetical protein [Paludibacterium sp.]MBV8647766.1 hypothetical protein [Paludibacterium sp.]
MASELYTLPLATVRARFARMRQYSPELLFASGIDELLPLLDHLTDTLPPLTRELMRAERSLRLIQARLNNRGESPPAAQLYAELDTPRLRVQGQTERLISLL